MSKNILISQNFITNQRLLKRIIRLSTIEKKDIVIEIGTGKGHLTRALCEECKYLYSVEIDKALFEKTQAKLSNIPNLQLIHGDFLNYKLPSNGRYKVLANIPYSITTKIIEKLTAAPNPPQDIWLVVEKGAAKRFMGYVRTPTKSIFSVNDSILLCLAHCIFRVISFICA